MKTLVVVITHPAARDILSQNWTWLTECCCDIVVVGHQGQPPPEIDYADGQGLKRMFINIGGPPESTPNRWLDRFIEVLQWCVSSSDTAGYDSYILCESDCIFLKPPPNNFGDMAGTLAGYKSEGFHASKFWHCPWCMTNEAAHDFLRRARIMIDFKLTEQGFIDRFIGAYVELYGVPIWNLAEDGQAYSRNTIELEHVEEATRAIAGGCFFLHGVKDKEVLRQITEGL